MTKPFSAQMLPMVAITLYMHLGGKSGKVSGKCSGGPLQSFFPCDVVLIHCIIVWLSYQTSLMNSYKLIL